MKAFRHRLFALYFKNNQDDLKHAGQIFILSEIRDLDSGPEVDLWDIDLVREGCNFMKKTTVKYADLVKDYASLYQYTLPTSDRYATPGGSWFRECRMMIPNSLPGLIRTELTRDQITIVMRSFMRENGEEYLTPYAVR